MADEPEDVVVKVEPEGEPPVAGAVEEKVVKTEEAVKKAPVEDLADQVKELEQERVAADARERAARAEANQARQDAAAARAAAVSSNFDTITTALASAQAEAAAAKRDLRAASEAGDHEALADAHERLAKASALSLRYDEAKADLEERKKAPPKVERPSDPVEAYVQGRAAPTADWLRSHREFVTDPRKNAKLTSAHYDAVSEGIEPDTPAYFEHVEKFMGLRKSEEKVVTAGDDVQRPGAKKVQARPVVAPVNGAPGTGGPVGGTEVRLKDFEVKAANDGTHIWNYDDPSGQKKFKKGEPIGTQEFARRKAKMIAQGVYDRSYETQ